VPLEPHSQWGPQPEQSAEHAPFELSHEPGSGESAAVGVHVPTLPPWLQDMHGALQLVLQHTLSTQWLLAHSPLVPHGWPLFFCALHIPLAQWSPVAHCPSFAHVVQQAAPLHAYGLQLTLVPLTQEPEPSQVSLVCTPIEQIDPHVVPAGAFAHEPLPSQRPVLPHGGLAPQPLLAGSPLGIARQRPLPTPFSASEHALHPPEQAVAQQ
jgi:hypothetical protein